MKVFDCCHCGRPCISMAHNAIRCKDAECQRARGREYRRYLRLIDKDGQYNKDAEFRRQHRVKYLIHSLRSRAKKSGIEFSLKESDIAIPTHCPVLGIELGYGVGYAKGNSPSVDRIDPKRGYVPDNIMVISHRANRIKSDAQPHEIQAIWRYVMKHYKPETISEQAGAK